MANNFRPDLAADNALLLLQRELVLSALVWRLGLADFRGKDNDTVTVRVPAVLTAREYEWRTRTAPIVLDDLTERAVSVVLDKHPYSAVALTDEELTLDIVNFTTQVLQPQMIAVAEKMESYVAAAMLAAPITAAQTVDLSTGTLGGGATIAGDPFLALLEAGRILNANNVPMSDRHVVLGSSLYAQFLGSDRISKASNSGDANANNALRQASLGSIAGFDNIVTSPFIPATSGYAFHRSAIAFANVAPANPQGASMSASRDYKGLAVRWLEDYDPNYLRDRSVVSAFAGATSVNDQLGDDAAVVGAGTTDPINVRIVKLVP